MTLPHKLRFAASASRAPWLTRNKCLLIGWIIGWASFTYASALVRVLQIDGGIAVATVAGRVFKVADDVPPYAKIIFGLVFLLSLLTLARGTANDPASGLGSYAIKGVIAALVATFVVLAAVPFDYFAGPGSAFAVGHGVAMVPHLGAALVAGAACALAAARCERRRLAS